MVTPMRSQNGDPARRPDVRVSRIKRFLAKREAEDSKADVSSDNTRVVRKTNVTTRSKKTNDFANPYKDTATRFNETYAEQGLQPTYKTQVDLKKNEDGEATPKQTLYKSRFSEQQKAPDQTTIQNVERNFSNKRKPNSKKNLLLNKLGGGSVKLLERKAAKARAKAANWSIRAWAWPLYVTLQIPIALLGLFFFGAAVAIAGIEASFTSTAVGAAIWKIGEVVFNTIGAASEALLGFNIESVLDPNTYFLLCNAVVILIGVSTISLMALTYQFSRVHYALGRAAPLKLMLLPFILFMYIPPFFNLFPWFVLWGLVVGYYPDNGSDEG